MSTRVELVTQQVVAALGKGTGPPGLTVHRHRTVPLADDTLPAIVVFIIGWDEERPERGAGTSWLLDLALECRAAESDTETADQALDPLFQWAVEALRQDETLKGMIDDFDNMRGEYRTERGDDGDRGALGIVVPMRVDSLWNDPSGVM